MLIELARRINAPMLATNDSHYTNAADAVAHDIAARIDEAHYREMGEVQILCAEADAIAAASFAARTPSWLRAGRVRVRECAGNHVTVEADGDVGYVFSKAIPGAADHAEVRAGGRAIAAAR
jgi:hypothetical protein